MLNILPSHRPRAITWLALLSAVILLASGGAAAAAIKYDNSQRNVMLEGVVVGSLDLGGLTFSAARERIEERYTAPLERNVVVEAKGQMFTVKASDFGAKTNAIEMYRRARDLGTTMSMNTRLWHRITGKPLATTLPVKTTFDEKKIRNFVNDVSTKVDQDPKESVPSFANGVLTIAPHEPGFKLDHKSATETIERVLLAGGSSIYLKGEETKPAITKDSITDVLVVKIGDNQLLHYQGETLVKTYGVATGTSSYPTPRGTFKIINKRYRPTWVNPAKYPGGWGWNLPARIGPGPNNPLGTRALDLNSPGIRIHGTYANNSIGYNASHGCIRMKISDVEELFDKVSTGTPVIILQTGPYRNQRKSSTVPEPTAESDATSLTNQPAPQA